MGCLPDRCAEWLEADGLGGFASGTVDGIRTRRYHALLLAATEPPAGRVVLVNGVEAWVDAPGGSFALTSHRYAPGVVHPDGARRLGAFTCDPWPRWTFVLPGAIRVEQEVMVTPGTPAVTIVWRLLDPLPGARLRVRPLLSGRDYHALHHENPAFRFAAHVADGCVTWQPYAGLPSIVARTGGRYVHEPDWYRNFLYAEEQARGLDCVEDLASPGTFHWDLDQGEAALALGTAPSAAGDLATLRAAERGRRARYLSRLQRAGAAYVVPRGRGRTVVAGYPWFTDWGRDTFVALRGLCLATGRLDDARQILSAWAGTVSDGMLPNRFPDRGDHPEYNSVDASLWFVIVVHELLARGARLATGEEKALRDAVEAILHGYAAGTRHGIRMDADGLLAAGEAGTQLTWMDARVDGRPVTPRVGKPVEVQALWVNALRLAGAVTPRWAAAAARAAASFETRFWHEAAGGLYDVIDVDHRPGAVDPAFRPNQYLAVGGLPFALVDGARARRIVDEVERRLWTPLGLRTLSPDAPGYHGRYQGGVAERDGAYHQGTVWPWLLGAFVEAFVRVRGHAPEAVREARARFFDPLVAHLDHAGIGHVSEIADGDPPHTPRGCPFQAWSVGEALRISLTVLGATPARSGVPGASALVIGCAR